MLTDRERVHTRPSARLREDPATLERAIESLRQEAFRLYAAVRAAQRASARHEECAEALRTVAMLNKRLTEDVRTLRVGLALEREDDTVVGTPI